MTDKTLARHETRLAAQVRAAFMSENRTKCHETTRAYFDSYASRKRAAIEAVKTCARRTHLTAEQIARGLNIWIPCDELVFVTPVSRKNSDCEYRFVLAFGPQNQARQLLVRNLLQARWNVSEHQTMFQGGREEAIRRVRKNFADGYRHIIEADIYHCFNSFDSEKIGHFLSLPESVVRHVLTGVTHRIVPSSSCRRNFLYHSPSRRRTPMELFEAYFFEEWGPARQGLIEGSKVSPFATELLLAPVCKAVSESGAGRVINYADNFLLMAKSRSELENLYNVLRESLHAHPAGPLQVKDGTTILLPDRSFEFLGYKLTPAGDQLDAALSASNDAKARQIRREAHKKFHSGMPRERKLEEYETVRRRHRGLIGAFPSWSGGEKYHFEKMSKLARLLDGQQSAEQTLSIQSAPTPPLTPSLTTPARPRQRQLPI